MKRLRNFIPFLLICLLTLSACQDTAATSPVSLEGIPPFSDQPYVVLEDNQPDFSLEELEGEAFESYSDLDALGRCGTAYARLGIELMPTQERESISQVKPSGWQTIRYGEGEGTYLYNRCHLIGFQLAGENANEENLITGTRYMNVDGMLPFENMVADYIKETENHVLYRVTPVYQGDELVARGVVMEGMSVEDQGGEICFHVYVYNNQPGMEIDYATGNAWEAGETPDETSSQQSGETQQYVLNTNSKKFHLPECSGVDSMSEKNRQDYSGSRQALLEEGYSPCQICDP